MKEDNFWAHFHLTVNEVPIIGFFLAAVFFGLSLINKKRNGWAHAGMLTLGISVVGGLLTFFSGDPAVDVISGQARTSNRALTQHHVRSIYAISFAVITAALAVIATLKARKAGGQYPVRWLRVVLIFTVLTLGALGWTGLAGGRINHPELQGPADKEGGPAHEH